MPLDPRGGKSFFPPHPFSPGWSRSGDLLLSAYLACGPHIERPVTARPPAGRAGDVEGYPLGEGREYTCGFPLFPPVNEPLLPPARAGGRAMRRWSWRPQARPLPDGTTFPRSSHQRMGFQGEGTSFPLVLFPPFLQRNGAPPGRAPFPPFQRRGPKPTAPAPKDSGREPASPFTASSPSSSPETSQKSPPEEWRAPSGRPAPSPSPPRAPPRGCS